ncbi:MAG: 16S rRNA (guanine(966)-N(2))-methyltransferase RsmD [Solirubrobacteraceae bacterium]
MRVIAGRYGGRPLRAPRGQRTRPTAELVRGAIFSMLGDISGATVLDLFAGTGALGLEALSRGAERALFVERDALRAAALKANIEALGLARQQARASAAGAVAAMRTAKRRCETYDLIFIDPPYAQSERWTPLLERSLPPLLAAAARVIVESDRRAPLRLDLPIESERRHGETLIVIHRNTANTSNADTRS